MRIRLLFFASYRDLAGTDRLDLELADGASVATLVDAVRGRSDALRRLPAEPVVAVNHEYADLDRRLNEGDEVALLPPVAGG